jgi:hypothetical protein
MPRSGASRVGDSYPAHAVVPIDGRFHTEVDPMSKDEHNGDDTSAQDLAQKKEEESEQAQEEMRKLEEGDLPDGIEDWPSGPAKYETFGKDDAAYGEGATAKLGPPNLTRHKDGSVSIDGEKVDDPDDYKGEPIAGGLPSED